MKRKSKYESAELEVVLLDSKDIITTSGDDYGSGNTDDGGWVTSVRA